MCARVFVLFAVLATLGTVTSMSTAIFRGLEPQGYDFQEIIFLMKNVGDSWETCTGTLISWSWVLTSGSCVKNFTALFLVAGKHDYKLYFEDRKSMPIDKVFDKQRENTLEERTSKRIENWNGPEDIALINVQPFKGQQSEGSTYLEPKGIGEEILTTSDKCTVVGFGGRNDEDIQYSMRCLDKQDIHFDDFETSKVLWVVPNFKQQLFRSGDYGGPLICKDKVYGVATPTASQAAPPGNSTNGYTNLYSLREWIRNLIKDDKPPAPPVVVDVNSRSEALQFLSYFPLVTCSVLLSFLN